MNSGEQMKSRSHHKKNKTLEFFKNKYRFNILFSQILVVDLRVMVIRQNYVQD